MGIGYFIIPHLAVKSKVLGVCGIAFEVSQGLLSDFTGTTFFCKVPLLFENKWQIVLQKAWYNSKTTFVVKHFR